MKWKVIARTFKAFGHQSDAGTMIDDEITSTHCSLSEAKEDLKREWYGAYLDWNASGTAGFLVDGTDIVIVHIDEVAE